MPTDRNVKTILVYVDSTPDDAIGENIMKLPFARALREAFPEAAVSWIPGFGPSYFEGLLEPVAKGLIDELITDLYIDDKPGELVRHFRPLKGRYFDLIIDTQRKLVRTLVLRRVRHKHFISPCWRHFFSDWKPAPEMCNTTLLTENLLALVAAAAGRVIRPSHVVSLDETWHEAARALLPDGPTYVGLAPGAGKRERAKCWPLERFIALARAQEARGRVPVFFIGPGEREWLEGLRREIPTAQFPEWEMGFVSPDLTGPPLALALGGRLAAAVANCSGIGHILAAGGAPMVSLFGPTRPEKFAPYTPHRILIRAQDFDPAGPIGAIPLDAVGDAVDRLIDAGARRRVLELGRERLQQIDADRIPSPR